jgi:hypothetical protein
MELGRFIDLPRDYKDFRWIAPVETGLAGVSRNADTFSLLPHGRRKAQATAIVKPELV